jgi:outer membrane protein TolC
MTITKTPFDIDFDANAERFRGLNEKVLTAAKQTGTMSIDAYEQTVNTLLDFGQKAADATKVDQISELAKTQATVIAEATAAYSNAVRDLLK